jgi:uncharacterized protein (TIGR00369 family)
MVAERLHFPIKVPFVESLGLELHAYGHGQSELRVDLAEAHLNSWEVAHGGVLMTMLDVSMAMAARSAMHPHLDSGGGVVTVEMKTSFMRPAQGELRALGKLLHRTSTLAFCEASVLDDTGQLCAHGTGTFKMLRGLPARGSIKQITPHPDAKRPPEEPKP